MNPCPLCGGASTAQLLEALQTPSHHVRPPRRAQRNGDFGDVTIVACTGCGHIFNAAFDASSSRDLYAIQATTNAPVSDAMLRGVREIATFIFGSRTDQPKILEIGCGVGTLARYMAERAESIDLIEPNLSVSNASFDDFRIKFLPGFFPEASREQRYDLIVCRQVLEHIDQPVQFLEAIRSHLTPTGEAYIEIPCADYIVDNASIVDLHYMHVQYFTAKMFEQLLARVGFHTMRSWLLKGGHDMGYLLALAPPDATMRNVECAGVVGLRERLKARRAAGEKKLRAMGDQFAIYGACAYSQSLLGLYSDMQAPAAVFDDTVGYRNQEVYHQAWRSPVVAPSAEALTGIRNVIIASYLHDRPIADRLVALGYSGSILTLRSDDGAGRTAPSSFFAAQ